MPVTHSCLLSNKRKKAIQEKIEKTVERWQRAWFQQPSFLIEVNFSTKPFQGFTPDATHKKISEGILIKSCPSNKQALTLALFGTIQIDKVDEHLVSSTVNDCFSDLCAEVDNDFASKINTNSRDIYAVEALVIDKTTKQPLFNIVFASWLFLVDINYQNNNKISIVKSLLNEKVKLQVKAKIEPVAIDTLFNLKKGDVFKLEQKLDQPFYLSISNDGALIPGYLLSSKDNKSMIIMDK
ncbi:hypothetical protein HR060_10955 [Catenovulum sp. SM1970]|uniref:hypothetical protein n=1 Tax=Marinifaba aquimaris TaxID=2741323 RepID=UPI0015716B25|nr:hypothetical protein [Marinifaba aquimaris]NTS77378.1 hypothetical protein [Marinifaba aquimaris]